MVEWVKEEKICLKSRGWATFLLKRLCGQRNLWLEPALDEPRRARRAGVSVLCRASRN
jgi:hypothetical protein